ncbi:MAG: Mobile element protein, partial [uncultured Rubellimicrobium sp.]
DHQDPGAGRRARQPHRLPPAARTSPRPARHGGADRRSEVRPASRRPGVRCELAARCAQRGGDRASHTPEIQPPASGR